MLQQLIDLNLNYLFKLTANNFYVFKKNLGK